MIAVHGPTAVPFSFIHVCVVDPDLMDLFIGLIMDVDTVVCPTSVFSHRSQFCPYIVAPSPSKEETLTQCHYNGLGRVNVFERINKCGFT